MKDKENGIYKKAFTKTFEDKLHIPLNLVITCSLFALFLWICSLSRHLLFQSNVYDLGIFDQWFWLISQGLEPISSITKVHVLADHGAWVIYLFALLYKLWSNVNWLFITQAISLSFTAIPLWLICTQENLNRKVSWLICVVWWLQPIVFNVNLFDFHPEVWAMPALAGCYLAAKNKNTILWLVLALFVIGCRDGMILITAGIGIEHSLRRNWKLSLVSLGVSISWFILINNWLFPYLKRYSNGARGATESILISLSSLTANPFQEIQRIDWTGGITYLILISIAFVPFWNRKSLPTLAGWIPLVSLNFIANNPSFRTLIHQYNLPIALIGVISIIDGMSGGEIYLVNYRKLAWVAACWFALAKPYFFTGPYLTRLSDLNDIYSSIKTIPSNASILTTSYIAPHLSHRKHILYPKVDRYADESLNDFDVILLNPLDPGWDSSRELQGQILTSAMKAGWECKALKNGLNSCQRINK